jgi:RNA recognition motif-containing protein
VPSVRLFVGNLPYQATEDDLRSHFGQVGPTTQIVRPLDRETGRARGFAFVEFADRALAEEAIKRFDGQLFMGRPLAVSEARAREDRGPGGPRPGGGFSPRPPGAGFGGPRPGGGGPGFGGPRYGTGEASGGSAPSRDRNFGPPAPPKGSKKGPKAGFKKDDNRPRGPIPTKFTGRMYDLDEVNEEDTADATPDFMKHDENDVSAEAKPDEGKEE